MSSVYRPIDVLEEQVDLVRFWRHSQYRHGFVKTFDFMVKQYQATRDDPLDVFLAERLDTAETFFVRSKIISRLWDFADAHEAHEHEVVLPQDLPCSRGFFYLENCIHIIDARGQVCSIRAILWSEENGGVAITQFSDAHDELDEVNHREQAQGIDASEITKYPLLHIMPWSWGRKILNLTENDFTVSDPNATPEDLEIVRKNMPTAAMSTSRFNAFVLSLWEFVQEQVPSRIPADRPMLKRLKRAHSPLSEVTIVELRPTDQPPQYNDPDHVPQTVLWTHRWRSRGHKRRWIDKHGNYRETTVSGSIKGPEHLPLIEKDRVYNVRR